MAVDLHLHTTHSDGSLTPSELVDYVKTFDVTTMAITDHDDVSGVEEGVKHGQKVGVRVIPGIELSIDFPLQGRAHLHLLGLYIDVNSPTLNATLQNLREARRTRAMEIVQRLKELNINVSFDELKEQVSGKSIGRPHIARLLMHKGVVTTIAEAFERYLGRDKPAYVPKKKLGLEEAIEVVHKANGLAIQAHPISLFTKDFQELSAYLDRFRSLGLDGVEAYYSHHSKELTDFLVQYAQKYGLAVSGGSDFHGTAKPDIRPAIGTGDLHIPPDVVQKLDAFHQRKFA